jgi:hypothetical protein
MLLLAVAPHLGLPEWAELLVRLAVPAAVLAWVSREPLCDWRPAKPLASVFIGVAVFAVWVGPDLLIPGWRNHWLFQNDVVGRLQASISADARMDPILLLLRILRAVIVVPVVEELFWRGWLLRWTSHAEFERVPLGDYSRRAFWITAVLFGLEHGPYWEVGIAAGAIYNGWLGKTRKLSDVILAHAVTNACLSLFVLRTGRWEYWM